MTEQLTYPRVRPQDLSPDALTLYQCGQSELKYDPFLTGAELRKARMHFRSRADENEYKPSARVLAAAVELETTGLGSLNRDYLWLYKTPLHPLYTVAEGRGAYLAQVFLSKYGDPTRDSDDPLLLTAIGGNFDMHSSNGPWQRWVLQVPHETATDFEHDTSKVAFIELANPVLMRMYGGVMTWGGVITDTKLYPFGTDPTKVEDGDTRTGTCGPDDGYGKDHEPHPFAPYQPPKRDETDELKGKIVRIELYPARAFEVER